MFRKRRGYGKKRVARKKGRKGVVRRAVGRARKSVFRKRVLRVVASTAESKVVNWRMPSTYVAAPASTEFGNSIYCLSPSNYTYGGITALSIVQGTGQGDRIGNKINPTTVTFKGVIRPNPVFNTISNYNPGPMYVVVWVVSLAKHLDDTPAILESVTENSFYQAGNVSTGMSGLLVDLTQTVNTAHITVHKRRVFKIGYSSYPSGSGVGAPNNANEEYNNNDFSLAKMFSMRLKFPKSITYNDGTTNPSSMRRWYYFAVPYRADGQYFVTNTSQVSGPTPLIVDFAVEMKFKDM